MRSGMHTLMRSSPSFDMTAEIETTEGMAAVK